MMSTLKNVLGDQAYYITLTLYSTLHFCITVYNLGVSRPHYTVNYSTVQYITVQYSTLQYSTGPLGGWSHLDIPNILNSAVIQHYSLNRIQCILESSGELWRAHCIINRQRGKTPALLLLQSWGQILLLLLNIHSSSYQPPE